MVCEEAEEPYRYGAINKGKDRYISGIVSPAAPHYVYGLINETQVLVFRHFGAHVQRHIAMAAMGGGMHPDLE